MSMSSNKKRRTKVFLSGFLGSLILFLVYFLITVVLSRDWRFPLYQFWLYKYWMSALTLGFGVQVGLFQYLRLKHLENMGTKATVGGGAGVSTISMVACCAHHLAEVVPILGLSALSLFLIKYQIQLFALGIFTNIIGIVVMIVRIRRIKC